MAMVAMVCKHAISVVIISFVFFAVRSVASAEGRVALVIGNAAYEHTVRLSTPGSDAAAIAEALRKLNFNVILKSDLNRIQFSRSLREFANLAEGADLAVVYYAGHGMQMARNARAENFLIPIDAKLDDDLDIEEETVPLTRLMNYLEAVKVRIVVLDACRDNPLFNNMKRTNGESRSTARGLAPPDVGARGTLVVFSTDPGATASDTVGGNNSPFAAAFLKHVLTPGLEISQLLVRVRQDVFKATDGRQTPWDNNGLMQEVYLTPSPQRPISDANVTTPAPAPSATDKDNSSHSELDIEYWKSIKESKNPKDFNSYLEKFPNGAFVSLAHNRLEDLNKVPAASVAPAAPLLATPTKPTPAPPLRQKITRAPVANGGNQATVSSPRYETGQFDGSPGSKLVSPMGTSPAPVASGALRNDLVSDWSK